MVAWVVAAGEFVDCGRHGRTSRSRNACRDATARSWLRTRRNPFLASQCKYPYFASAEAIRETGCCKRLFYIGTKLKTPHTPIPRFEVLSLCVFSSRETLLKTSIPQIPHFWTFFLHGPYIVEIWGIGVLPISLSKAQCSKVVSPYPD